MNCSICKTSRVGLNRHCGSYSYSSSDNGVGVCNSCYGEFNNMMNKTNCSATTQYQASWGTINARQWNEEAEEKVEQLKWEMGQVKEKEVKQVKEEMRMREEWWISFLGGLAAAFTEERYSDIQVKPGNGPSIHAHKFLLATRSTVFKHMLSSDTCKAGQIDSVCLPEFNHEELEAFLEFLYCGNLAKEKFEVHYHSLALASHKYAIPHLQMFCEENILKLLDSSNALKVLEISEICSNETLKVAALESIIKHKKEIICSPSFDEFAIQNPHLMVYITRHWCTQF